MTTPNPEQSDDQGFIGGSRHVSRLTAPVLERLHTIMEKELSVIVGDANGGGQGRAKLFFQQRLPEGGSVLLRFRMP